jgi:hypothetical protein
MESISRVHYCLQPIFEALSVFIWRTAAVPMRSPSSTRSLTARGLRRVALLVPTGCAEGLRRLARELRLRQDAGIEASTAAWRRLSRSAELFVDPQSGARTVVRATGANGAGRFLWTLTVFDEHQIAEGRAHAAAEAQLQAEAALATYLNRIP